MLGMAEISIPSPLLKEHEAAAYLTISVATLQRLRKAGRIAHINLSERQIRYRKDQLDEYIAQNEVDSRG